MKPSTYIILIVLFLVLPGSTCFSQPPWMKGGPGMGMRPWREGPPCWRANDLNLSPEQMKRLDLIHQTYLQETQVLRAELLLKRLELQEFLTNPNTRVESIRSKNSEITELESKLEEKTLENLIKVRSLLTQEQLRIWCPEQEFPPLRRMMRGSSAFPRHPPFQEGEKED